MIQVGYWCVMRSWMLTNWWRCVLIRTKILGVNYWLNGLKDSDVCELPVDHVAILFEIEFNSGRWFLRIDYNSRSRTFQTTGISAFKAIRGIRDGPREILPTTGVSLLKLFRIISRGNFFHNQSTGRKYTIAFSSLFVRNRNGHTRDLDRPSSWLSQKFSIWVTWGA